VTILRDPFTGEAQELRVEVPKPHGPPLIVPVCLNRPLGVTSLAPMMKRVWTKERVEAATKAEPIFPMRTCCRTLMYLEAHDRGCPMGSK
jgi:hypothetical protein